MATCRVVVAGSWPDLVLVRSGRTPRAMAKGLDPRNAPRCIAGIYLVFTKMHAAVQNDATHSRMLNLLGRLVSSSAYFLGSIALHNVWNGMRKSTANGVPVLTPNDSHIHSI
jgi:hypothetical protein